MSFKAMDALFPDWNVWEEYVDGITSGGIALDSLRSSHAVEVPVAEPNEIEQTFDPISYNEGGSVLRMLEQALGEKSFQQGISLYLRRDQYGLATSEDLGSQWVKHRAGIRAIQKLAPVRGVAPRVELDAEDNGFSSCCSVVAADAVALAPVLIAMVEPWCLLPGRRRIGPNPASKQGSFARGARPRLLSWWRRLHHHAAVWCPFIAS